MKTLHPRAIAFATALVMAFGWLGPAMANPTFTTFDVPGAVGTYPTSIAGNRIAGNWYDGTTYHGFLRKPGGQIAIIDPAGSTYTSICCINASGEVAGSYSDGATLHGFYKPLNGAPVSFDLQGDDLCAISALNANGDVGGSDCGLTGYKFFVRDSVGGFTFCTVQVALPSFARPAGMNDAGYLVGTAEIVHSDGPNTFFGLICAPNGTLLATFQVPGPMPTSAFAIDQNNRVTGSYGNPTQSLGFVRHPNTNFDTFAHPGASIDGGKVTGSFQNAQSHQRGFIRDPGVAITNVHVPGSVDTYSVGIWNGSVTGNYTDSNGISHGYLRTP